MNQKILFQRLSPEARIPYHASEHAAGFDLVSMGSHVIGNQIIVNTGIATAFDENHVLLIYGRSGYAFKHGITLANGVGVIDADYRGEIKLAFRCGDVSLREAARLLDEGHRVAQAILTPIPHVLWEEVEQLPETVRGTGGFGSTGLRA